MDKGTPSGLFVNDGSFMERFKQLQRVKEKDGAKNPIDAPPSTRPAVVVSVTSKSILAAGRSHIDAKMIDPRNSAYGSSGGKLAFSLKQKSKLLTPVKLTTDDEEDETAVRNDSGDSPLERQKLSPAEASKLALTQSYIAFSSTNIGAREIQWNCGKLLQESAAPSPTDPTVRKVADRLANFVAKHGRQLEHVTPQKNPGDTPFKLVDEMPRCLSQILLK